MSAPAEYFELLIWKPGQGPMRDLIQARTLQDAIHLARFKYKNAKVEIPSPAAKPELIRTHTSPVLLKKRNAKKAQQRADALRQNDTNS